MLHLLPSAEYVKVQALFAPLRDLLYCKAVLHGAAPGQVFVDDLDAPRSAFLLTRDTWGCLAGAAQNEAFNQALHTALFEGQIVAPGAFGLIFAISDETWTLHFSTIFGKYEPIYGKRMRYSARLPLRPALVELTQAALPAGYELAPIDAGLVQRSDLKLPDEVYRLAQALQERPEGVESGFGFVVLHKERAAAYALVECVVDGASDITLETGEAYRRKPWAAVALAAAIDYGLSHGLKSMLWDCAANDQPWMRMAQKLGLLLNGEQVLYFVDYEFAWHQLSLAGAYRDRGEYAPARVVCQRLLQEEPDPPDVTWYMLACVQAGLGELDGALDSLEEARRRGWYNPQALRARAEFEPLHAMPRWEALF